MDKLPEEILSDVISRTTPRDACAASAVCRAFRSAADYDLFLFEAVDPVEYASKKELYFRLCDYPLLIDDGLMDFALEKSTGAKIFMISARMLKFLEGDDIALKWIPGFRFDDRAVVKALWSLVILGYIDCAILTAATSYAVYLIYELAPNMVRLSPNDHFQNTGANFSGDTPYEVCLNVGMASWFIPSYVKCARRRQDGWNEVKFGTFNSGDGSDGEVQMTFRDRYGCWTTELIVQGFEIRPQH